MKAQLTMTCTISGYQYRTEAERKTRAQIMEWAHATKQYLEGVHKPGEPKSFEVCMLYPNGTVKTGTVIYL